ncbi:hypothetical protein [Novosphingobium gossypii]|uniref:hypothetical protein n=1 Tax=Novosphingobium gossypii TaxID=1604774 RepID=UPI003D1BA6A5
MAKRPLKVFRTAIGFHDAYVAATSRKAALEAWGAATDLFASGSAEPVTDPKLTKTALAQPGVVIRVARGTTAQHLAAAGKRSRRGADASARNAPVPAPAARKQKKTPKPSRASLDRAEAALSRKSEGYAAGLAAIEAKIDALRAEREALRQERDAALRKLEQRRAAEERNYRDALDAWEA